MHSWPEIPVPSLPGSGPRLRLHDSSTGEIRRVDSSGTATMYICGITPYDATHLGHAATYLTFDLVQRVLRDNGLGVRYVQNVTDVDDPLIERAERDGITWQDLAVRETDLFRSDMQVLRIIPPTDYLGAVETIPLVVEAVETLLHNGSAYRLVDGSGDIYYDISADDRFGYVSGYDAKTMLQFFAERGGDPDREGKRQPLDPLLWKGKRENDPSWPSPIGEGRPGWHIECAAIAMRHLGPQIDIQGGGEDLRFPHHECSAAHAESISGQQPFARHYTHAGMIGYQGEKMSKSLGNLVKVSVLTAEGVDPMAIRLGLLHGHYRQYREWTDEYLHTAHKTLSLWREAVRRPIAPSADATIAAMRECLANDLDTDGAVAAVTRWATERPLHNDSGMSSVVIRDAVDALLGIAL